jgi:hypothetical protein
MRTECGPEARLPVAGPRLKRSSHELEKRADALVSELAFAKSAQEMQGKARDAGALLARFDSLGTIPEAQETAIRRDLLYLQRDVSRLLKAGHGADVLTDAQAQPRRATRARTSTACSRMCRSG